MGNACCSLGAWLCIVRRALECEIQVLGKHVNFRVGLDFERGLDHE